MSYSSVVQKKTLLVSFNRNFLCKVKNNNGSWCKLTTPSAANGSTSGHILSSQRFLHHGARETVFDSRNTSFSKPNVLYCQSKQGRYKQPGSHSSLSVHSGRVDVEDQPPSWLFVSPAVAGAYGAQVNVELDLEERLGEEMLQALRENVKLRGLSMDIDGLVSLKSP